MATCPEVAGSKFPRNDYNLSQPATSESVEHTHSYFNYILTENDDETLHSTEKGIAHTSHTIIQGE
jgi:hypothetical protein